MPEKGKPESHTPFVQLMVQRYHDTVYDETGAEKDYEAYADYLALINGPREYGVEPEMLRYAKGRTDATVKELLEHFYEITPEGLAPGDDGADLLE